MCTARVNSARPESGFGNGRRATGLMLSPPLFESKTPRLQGVLVAKLSAKDVAELGPIVCVYALEFASIYTNCYSVSHSGLCH